MGPSKLFHKNRSAHSLLGSSHEPIAAPVAAAHPNANANASSSAAAAAVATTEHGRSQHSLVDSPLNSPAFPPSSPPHYHHSNHNNHVLHRGEDDDDHSDILIFSDQRLQPDPQAQAQQAARYDEAHQFYNIGGVGGSVGGGARLSGPGGPRSPQSINTNFQQQPTFNLLAPLGSTPNSAIDEVAPPDAFYRPQQQQDPSSPPHLTQKEDRKKRRFFGIGSKDSSSHSAAGKPGRTTSVRRSHQIADTVDPAEAYRIPADSLQTSPTDDLVGLEEEEADRRINLHQQGQDRSHIRTASILTGAHNRWHPGERQPIHESPWARASNNVHQRAQSEAGQLQGNGQLAAGVHPTSSLGTSGHSVHSRSSNDQGSQHWSEQQQQQQTSRPSSRQSSETPLPPPHTGTHHHRGSIDTAHHRANPSQGGAFAAHSGAQSLGVQSSTSQSLSQQQQQQDSRSDQVREGGYIAYGQGNTNVPGQVTTNQTGPHATQLTPQTAAYMRNTSASPMNQATGHPDGRHTPPPNRSKDDLTSSDFAQLQAKHDELQEKYRKVKKYYFDKDAQVQQLQNTIAHQRLSMSRTSLDDNEYSSRFSRLDGAINNLAFNLRRDWRQVPPWLAPHVNRDATTAPTKEMTAVGRAAISRWLVDELLDRFFHPGLDPSLSAQLKIIEKNLWRHAPQTTHSEEKEGLLAKVSSWRLTTLDGLHESLSSQSAAENRAALTDMLIEKLIASLGMMLKDPMPPGIEGGVGMIIELAVGIAANLPLESRDVFVEYVLPGTAVDESYMKLESGLPPLTNPGDGPADGSANTVSGGSLGGGLAVGDTSSMASRLTDDTGSDSGGSSNPTNTAANNSGGGSSGNPADDKDASQQGGTGKKKGMFGAFMNVTGSSSSQNSATSNTANNGGGAAGGGGANAAKAPNNGKKGPAEGAAQGGDRVRLSTFMAVEVRGRSVLVKAPVYIA